MAKKVIRTEAGKKVTRDNLSAGLRAVFNADTLNEAIAADQEAVVKELTHFTPMIPIEQIAPNPAQPRNQFDEEALDELANSIKVHGLIQPITVRLLEPNKYQIISGERRFRASQKAGIKEVPAYVRLANDTEMLEMALIENIQRQDLNSIEVALTYARLKDECKLTDAELSSRMGKDRSTITNYLRLLKLPDTVQTALRDRIITFGHGRALASVDDYVKSKGFFDLTMENHLSVRALENLIASEKSSTVKEGGKKASRLPDEYEDVQKRFREFFGAGKLQLKVNAEGKGQIIIPFGNTKDLNSLLDRLED
ncbi:ParB/RepB/Spo0J family partition protein [Haliscomenobacter hydrossis]|uniref:ParB-like partition protein n=1 Tax=Haliscomenobacter hydrossis (strain ATCC 27775 / DSM 1100 / LMG 10767 / O) TaxID=760192 RepID=F4L3W0_HALH1|nr:ParB/RepB/Spo0J family partition protein [Haliscomenobacter hydrossis]AEE48714.1 parB-like partition protein [Haliscomenobacter hydrossis DSM 1100]